MNKIRWFPIILIFIGLIILIDNLGWMNNAWSQFWPLTLVIIGGVMVINSFE